MPHRFYFAVPEKIAEKCTLYIKENKLKYGLIEVAENVFTNRHSMYELASANEAVKIKIPAKKLHENIVLENVKYKIVRRMSSELSQRNGELYCKTKS